MSFKNVLESLLEEQENTVKVRVGILRSLYAKYQTKTLSLPLAPDHNFMEEHDIQPNKEKDVKLMLKNVKEGKMFITWDVYGDGVIGYAPMTVNASELKNAVKKEMGEE